MTNAYEINLTAQINTADIYDFIADNMETLRKMEQDDNMDLGPVQVWCDWNSLMDEEFEEADRFAEYELCTSLLNIKVQIDRHGADITDIKATSPLFINTLGEAVNNG